MDGFKRWSLSNNDLKDITVEKARDLVVKCLLEAQKETFIRAKKQLGKDTSDEEIEKSIVASIRTAFRDVKGDYSNPSKETLMAVVQLLAKLAKGWGTPEDIINYHKEQMGKVLNSIS